MCMIIVCVVEVQFLINGFMGSLILLNKIFSTGFLVQVFRPLGFLRPVEALDQGTLPPPISKFKGSHPFKNTGIPEFYEKISQNGDPNKGKTSHGKMVPFLGFGSLFGPYFIKVGVTVSQGSNPLNETELTRKNLPPKNGRKNLNKDFTNTGREGGHHFVKVFH